MPLSARDLEVLDWFYGLTQEQIEELKTGRRQQFGSVMAYLPGEIEKAYAAEKQLSVNPIIREKNNPPKWREFLRAKYSQDVRLPPDFDDLDADLRREYEAGIESFEEGAT